MLKKYLRLIHSVQNHNRRFNYVMKATTSLLNDESEYLQHSINPFSTSPFHHSVIKFSMKTTIYFQASSCPPRQLLVHPLERKRKSGRTVNPNTIIKMPFYCNLFGASSIQKLLKHFMVAQYKSIITVADAFNPAQSSRANR